MGRETRKVSYEVDDGTTAETKRGGRGGISVPPGLSMFKPKKNGSHTLDIIPFPTTENRDRFADKMRYSSKRGVLYPERTYWVHYGVGINNDAFACSARNFGKPCPVCQDRAKYLEEPDGESQDKANALKPKQRQLWLVYDNDEPEKGIQLWEVSQFNFGRHIEDYIEGFKKDERGSYRVYYHPDKGMTIRVTCKEATTGQNTYTDFLVHSMSPRVKALPEEIFEHEYDLDEMVVLTDYDVFKRVYLGLDEESDVPTDGDEVAPAPRTQQSRNGDGDRDEAPPPKRPTPREDNKPYLFATGDRIAVEFKGEEVEGVVEKVDLDSKMAHVKLDGRDKSIKFEFSDLRLIERDTTFDAREAPKSRIPQSKPDDDEDNRTFKPKTKAVAPADDDDNPPPKKKR